MRVLIEFNNKPLYFEHPRREIVCHDPRGFRSAWEDIARAQQEGFWVAGYASYEAGLLFEPTLGACSPSEFPFLYFGIFDKPSAVRDMGGGAFTVRDRGTNIAREAYGKDIECIRDHIRRGNVYQITYCIKQRFGFSGSAPGLYQALKRYQPVPYAAYIEAGENRIVSLSPEMFFRKEGARIEANPMKGSWPRGGLRNDLLGGWLLRNDPKNRAENVMIADLLRNDLGRIGRAVRVPSLFDVARYRTIYQMTSCVTAEVPADTGPETLFRAVFPSGSVTGAPKVEAMRIIRGLEREPRHIYTGAIGYFSPRGDAFFNVPIRTLLLRGTDGEMGIGGGIVWDSTSDGEWEEGRWKARFLTELF